MTAVDDTPAPVHDDRDRTAVKRTGHRRTSTRPRRRRWVAMITLGCAGLLLAITAVAVLTGAYQIRPVLSGSMRPGLPVGGVVVTERIPLQDVQVRDVIVFHRPGQPSELIVHRLISVSHRGDTVIARTQGDANDAPDPWTLKLHGASAYRAVFSVPLIGYPAVWFADAGGRRLLLMLAGLLVVGTAVSMLRDSRRRPTADAGTDTDADAPEADTAAPEADAIG